MVWRWVLHLVECCTLGEKTDIPTGCRSSAHCRNGKRLFENPKISNNAMTCTKLYLNPIENLWASLKKGLECYGTTPHNFEEFWSRVQTVWSNIPRTLIENLMESMPKRNNSMLKAEGHWVQILEIHRLF